MDPLLKKWTLNFAIFMDLALLDYNGKIQYSQYNTKLPFFHYTWFNHKTTSSSAFCLSSRSVCYAICHDSKMFDFDLLFDPYQSLTLKVKLRSYGHGQYWATIVYVHTKYEHNTSTGSWAMRFYNRWPSFQGQCQIWPHGAIESLGGIYQYTI